MSNKRPPQLLTDTFDCVLDVPLYKRPPPFNRRPPIDNYFTMPVETLVTVNNNSPVQDYVHPDDHAPYAFKLVMYT